MDNIDYKNGYVLLISCRGLREIYYSTEVEVKTVYTEVVNAINRGDKVVNVRGINEILFLDDIQNMGYKPAAPYIRERYEWWHDPERDEYAGNNWTVVEDIKNNRAKYSQLMVRIGEHPEPVEGE